MLDSLSVIIPSYQRPNLTLQAVRSIALQSWIPRFCEVIVVDDASSPEASEALQKSLTDLAKDLEKPVLRFLRLKSHLGRPGAVRNAGLLRAGGDWIALLDSDDLWYQEKLALQREKLRQKPWKICHGRERWLRYPAESGGGERRPETLVPREISQKKQRHPKEGNVFEAAARKCMIGPSTVLFHKEILRHCGYFSPLLEIAEDYQYFLRICAKYPIAYVSQPIVDKRDGLAPQLSHRYSGIEPFRIQALESLLHSPGSARQFDRDQRAILQTEIRRKYQICLNGAQKRGRLSEVQNLRNRLLYWQQVGQTECPSLAVP